MTGTGFLIAAPASQSGKTTLTLGLARALKERGHAIRTAKAGPDYIDAGFHHAATGRPSLTLDPWAMSEERLKALAAGDGVLIVEGAMGLFDGAGRDGAASPAALAKTLGLPVILAVDCTALSHSVAPLVAGFLAHDPGLAIRGMILNNVGSARHEAMLRQALADCPVPLLGAVTRRADITRPSRHLGLVPAGEHPDTETYVSRTAEHVAECVDLPALLKLAGPLPKRAKSPGMAPLGKSIAVARDAAFAFTYPHMEADWRAAGAVLTTFSPLADETPPTGADAIFLPGGYPELHAQALARAGRFRTAMRAAALRGTTIYGECGGFMVLGQSITDKRGISYPMTGLLDIETSFAARKLHLGYRRLTPLDGPFEGAYTGHEFHYSTTLRASGTPLFAAEDSDGRDLGQIGLISGSVAGSFAHLIDQATT